MTKIFVVLSLLCVCVVSLYSEDEIKVNVKSAYEDLLKERMEVYKKRYKEYLADYEESPIKKEMVASENALHKAEMDMLKYVMSSKDEGLKKQYLLYDYRAEIMDQMFEIEIAHMDDGDDKEDLIKKARKIISGIEEKIKKLDAKKK